MRNREARETGYIGQNSEVQWLRSIQRQAERGSANSNLQRHGPPGTSSGAADERIKAMHERRQNTSQGSMHHTTDATFYLDNDDIEIDIAVDPYELPDPGVAEHLFNCYLETVHNNFPLMPEDFEDQFRRYIQSAKHQHPYEVPVKWRITMNLLFAIGAKYSQLIGASWRGDERDHLVYMTRAMHLLRLNDPLGFITAPTIDRVQAVRNPCSCVNSKLLIHRTTDRCLCVLLPRNWPCKPSLGHDRDFYQARLGSRAPPTQRECLTGRYKKGATSENMVVSACYRVLGIVPHRPSSSYWRCGLYCDYAQIQAWIA